MRACGVYVWCVGVGVGLTLVESIAHIYFAVSPVPEKIAVNRKENE